MGWEKLFCKSDFGVGFSGLQMCFCHKRWTFCLFFSGGCKKLNGGYEFYVGGREF